MSDSCSLPRCLTHCSECDRPFPEPVEQWDDYFAEIEDVAFMCDSCASSMGRPSMPADRSLPDALSKRLRDGVLETRAHGGGVLLWPRDASEAGRLMREAADEIERLTDRLDRALCYREAVENLPEGTLPR